MRIPELDLDVVYVRAARFNDEGRSKRCYEDLMRTCWSPERGYELGVNRALWQGRDWVVVVSAIVEMPPQDVQDNVTRALRRGTPWEVPVGLMQTIVMRRLRQSGRQLEEDPNRHMLAFRAEGINRRVDSNGLDEFERPQYGPDGNAREGAVRNDRERG